MKIPLYQYDSFTGRIFGGNRTVEVDLCGHATLASAPCELTPCWAKRLGKQRLVASRVSARLGEPVCELKGERVFLSGRVAKYLEGVIEL